MKSSKLHEGQDKVPAGTHWSWASLCLVSGQTWGLMNSSWTSQLLVSLLSDLQTTLSLQNLSESCPALNLPSKGCWDGILWLGCSILTPFVPNSGSSTALGGFFLFTTTCVSDAWISKMRTVQNQSSMLTSKWHQNLAQCISVCIRKLLFTTSITNFSRWPPLTPNLLSSFCFYDKTIVFCSFEKNVRWKEIRELSRNIDIYIFQHANEGTCKKQRSYSPCCTVWLLRSDLVTF